MDLEGAKAYLTLRIKEAPLGSPQQRDYIERRRRVQRHIDALKKPPDPPKAA